MTKIELIEKRKKIEKQKEINAKRHKITRVIAYWIGVFGFVFVCWFMMVMAIIILG